MKEYMTIGQIINTHGLKGELKVYPLTDDISRYRKLKKVYIDNTERKVIWCKTQIDKIIMKIEGIDSIEEALKYKNVYLEVKREDAVKLPEGRYYISDLLECTVYDTNNEKIGKIFNVIQTPANDVYWIKEEKEILIPALKDIVLNVDIEEKKITIRPVSEWNED
jgi:16S rRNA processing protein RimM